MALGGFMKYKYICNAVEQIEDECLTPCVLTFVEKGPHSNPTCCPYGYGEVKWKRAKEKKQ
jgi:hypothetical protein